MNASYMCVYVYLVMKNVCIRITLTHTRTEFSFSFICHIAYKYIFIHRSCLQASMREDNIVFCVWTLLRTNRTHINVSLSLGVCHKSHIHIHFVCVFEYKHNFIWIERAKQTAEAASQMKKILFIMNFQWDTLVCGECDVCNAV